MPLVMRVAWPPAIGIVYRSPRMSKTIVWPFGETSSEIHDASSVVNLSVRDVMSGKDCVRPAALIELSFCVAVCAARAAPDTASDTPNARARRTCFMHDLREGMRGGRIGPSDNTRNSRVGGRGLRRKALESIPARESSKDEGRGGWRSWQSERFPIPRQSRKSIRRPSNHRDEGSGDRDGTIDRRESWRRRHNLEFRPQRRAIEPPHH